MSKDELVEWIVKKQVGIKMNDPATPEILLDNQYKKGLTKG